MEEYILEKKTNVNMVMFDFIKGLAMIAVVLTHSGAASYVDSYPGCSENGREKLWGSSGYGPH